MLNPFQDGVAKATAKCVLKLCCIHCVRNAVEPGHAGRSHLKGSADEVKNASGLLGDRIYFSGRRLTLVLFDLFWFWTLLELMTGTITSFGKQKEWADYFRKHKLFEEVVNGVKLMNAYWRTGSAPIHVHGLVFVRSFV
jgi:hypothetical protein